MSSTNWPTEVARRDAIITKLRADLESARADLKLVERARDDAQQLALRSASDCRRAREEADRFVASARAAVDAADLARTRAEAAAVESRRRVTAERDAYRVRVARLAARIIALLRPYAASEADAAAEAA